ncbi:antibiotic biosynthesis monooxygenase [Geodermatophilaceae bacterium NBWT11]|nr:antibiotic biosynthesis monooxygenase [Geodermatophilaceae bacterium NBWT11]
MSVTVIATITPRPERFDAVREAFEQVVPLVHEEPGCELYALYASKTVLVMVERWADAAALNAHGGGATFTGLAARVQDDLAAPFDVQVVRPVPAGDPAKGQLA